MVYVGQLGIFVWIDVDDGFQCELFGYVGNVQVCWVQCVVDWLVVQCDGQCFQFVVVKDQWLIGGGWIVVYDQCCGNCCGVRVNVEIQIDGVYQIGGNCVVFEENGLWGIGFYCLMCDGVICLMIC